MRIAYVGDLHLIDSRTAPPSMAQWRRKFIDSVPRVEEQIEWLNVRRPDHVFFTGDIIDWYSEGNLGLAHSILTRLEMPWAVTPGNHDVSGDPGATRGECFDTARKAFAAVGIEIDNRVFDFDAVRVLLIDSHASRVDGDCGSFVLRNHAAGKKTVIVTHVPLEVSVTGSEILAAEPHRNLTKYTLAGSPGFFDAAVKGYVHEVYTGHLHFPLDLHIAGTVIHILPLACRGTGSDPHAGVRIVEY